MAGFDKAGGRDESKPVIISVRFGKVVHVNRLSDYYVVDYDNAPVGKCPLCSANLTDGYYCPACEFDWGSPRHDQVVELVERHEEEKTNGHPD